MALGSTTSSSSHVGNNSTSTPYTVGFRFDDDAELVVTVSDPTGSQVLVDGVDYTLSGSGEAGTATFVTTQAWDNTVTVTAKRETSLLQPYTPGTPLDTADLENAFDRTLMAVQDTRREADTKIDLLDIVNTLTSTATDKALGASMGKSLKDAADSHVTNVSNPHSVTKAQVGLANADNTADASKPVSSLQAAAIAAAKNEAIAASVGGPPQYTEAVVESGTSRTLTTADNGRVIYCTHASGCTITVPTSLGFPFVCGLVGAGGAIALEADSGVTLDGVSEGTATIAQGYYPSQLLATSANVLTSGKLEAAAISDSTATGRALLTAASPSTARTALYVESFVNVKEFGATGDGVTDDSAAFQAALDTGKSVYVPPGDYIMGSTKLQMRTRGQRLFGMSPTICILEWTGQCDGIEIAAHSVEPITPNNPGGIATQNVRTTIENLFIKGVNGSDKTFTFSGTNITIASHGYQTADMVLVSTSGTLPSPLAVATDYYVIVVDANTIRLATSHENAVSGTAISLSGGSGTQTMTRVTRGIYGSPRIGEANNWNCELVTIRACLLETWEVGFELQYASKLLLDSTVAKSCGTYGYWIHGATNNCPAGLRVTCTSTPTGMRFDGVKGGDFHLGDFGENTIGVLCLGGGNATFRGGELETFSDTFFDFTDGRWNVLGCRFLNGSPSSVPAIKARGRSTTFVAGIEYGSLASSAYLADMEVSTAVIFGVPGAAYGYANKAGTTASPSRYLDYNDVIRTIGMIPVAANDLTFSADMAGMLWLEANAANYRAGDQLLTVAKNGDGTAVKHYLLDDNVRRKDVAGTNGAPAGWEGATIYTNTAAKACSLPKTNSNALRVSQLNGKRFILVNSAATGDVTVTPYSSAGINFTAAGDTMTATSHGYATGDRVFLTTTGTLPTGLATSTPYWVIYATANTFKLASSYANANTGTAITTSGGSGNHTVARQDHISGLSTPITIAPKATATLLTFGDGDWWFV